MKLKYLSAEITGKLQFRGARWLLTHSLPDCMVIKAFIVRPTERQLRVAAKKAYQIQRREAAKAQGMLR